MGEKAINNINRLFIRYIALFLMVLLSVAFIDKYFSQLSSQWKFYTIIATMITLLFFCFDLYSRNYKLWIFILFCVPIVYFVLLDIFFDDWEISNLTEIVKVYFKVKEKGYYRYWYTKKDITGIAYLVNFFLWAALMLKCSKETKFVKIFVSILIQVGFFLFLICIPRFEIEWNLHLLYR